MQNLEFTLFSNQWEIYQKIIRNNYMFHQEIGQFVNQELQLKNSNGHFNFVDLGCGDASQIAELLNNKNCQKYIGYDLSEASLDIAKLNFKDKNIDTQFIHAPMQDFVELSIPIDIIYSSYAIHHLQEDAIFELLKNIFKNLKKQGFFIWIDLFRIKNLTIQAYRNDYIGFMKMNWDQISKAEKNSIEEHIQNCDFPANIDSINIIAKEIGFSLIREKWFDSKHAAFLFKKE